MSSVAWFYRETKIIKPDPLLAGGGPLQKKTKQQEQHTLTQFIRSVSSPVLLPVLGPRSKPLSVKKTTTKKNKQTRRSAEGLDGALQALSLGSRLADSVGQLCFD